jgi:hypothetical protein
MLKRTPVDRIFIDSVSSVLSRTTLPDFQRSEDSTHVNDIYNSVTSNLDAQLEPKITGCLITVLLDDTCYLLDGNHRLHAYKRILEDYDYDIKLYVQEIKVSDLQEAETLFNQTNNSIPVSKMPDGVKRSHVNRIAEYFYNKYNLTVGKKKPVFSASNTTNRPRINRAKFEETLSHIVKCSDLDAETIITKIDNYIIELDGRNYQWFKRSTNDTQKRLENMLNTADALGCRLGMVRIGELSKLFQESDMTIFQRVKQHIPKALKIKVWDRYCGASERVSECPFCNDLIKTEDFHCAHDQSEIDGGELNIDNLYPCCALCNLSMGTSTYEQFKKRWTPAPKVTIRRHAQL